MTPMAPIRPTISKSAPGGQETPGQTLCIQLATYGLTAANYIRVKEALDGWCELVDASDLVRSLRLVKSPAELAYMRRAAALADEALIAMQQAATISAFEGDIMAAGQGTIFRGGGDMPASGPGLWARATAPCCCAILPAHAPWIRRIKATIEFAAVYRRYHACLMAAPGRLARIGPSSASCMTSPAQRYRP